MRKGFYRIRPIILTSVLLLGLCSLTSPTRADGPLPVGVAITPAESGQLVDALIRSLEVTNTVAVPYLWNTPGTNQVKNCASVAPLFHVANSLDIDLMVRFEAVLFGQPMTPLNLGEQSWANPQVEAAYLDEITCLATFQPDYVVLGPEINIGYMLNQEEYYHYAAVYKKAYEILKTLSPGTRVGVSYHYQFMLWFNQWPTVLDLGPQDFIGFTMYFAVTDDNYMQFPHPALVPQDYFAPIRSVFGNDIPIIFTEYAWSTYYQPQPERRQAQFLAMTPQLMQPVNPELVMLAGLHDIAEFGDFIESANRIGLLNKDGTPKLSWYFMQALMESGHFLPTVPNPQPEPE